MPSATVTNNDILYSGCSCVYMSVIIYWKFANVISYKLLVGISPNLQLRCSCWTD